jgi:enamine deaminase RidA (YjgF/YER057c/UK114 family)
MHLSNISYQIIKPKANSDFYAEWHNCGEQLTNLLKIEPKRIFKVNIFVYDDDNESFQLKKQYIKEELQRIFGENCPTFGVLPQSPEKPYNVTIELGVLNSPELRIDYRKHDGHLYTVIERDEYKEVWVNGLEDKDPELNTEFYSRHAFDKVNQILSAENMTFDHIVRQWNYIGNILGKDEHDRLSIQHYQIFNDVRHDYYGRYRLSPDFPAATGIGMNFKSVAIDFCAISSTDEMLISSINNPKQINPYAYDQKVLIGSPSSDKEQKTPPQFERAKLIEYRDTSKLFISGTASIIGQETKGIGDIETQTRITIENIITLMEKGNHLHQSNQIKHYTPGNCSYVRVYVKHLDDIPRVKKICATYFGNSPVNYVQANICREELLVEIEAELNLNN